MDKLKNLAPPFQPGWKGGPGRPKGSVNGRTRVIQLIDDLMLKHAGHIEKHLESELKRNPGKFWKNYGFPLVPQTLIANVRTEEGSPWLRLNVIYPTKDSLPSSHRMPVLEPCAADGDGARPCALPPTCSTGQVEKHPAIGDGSPRPTSSQSEG